MPYTQTYSGLYLCSLDESQHARTCNYWWTVTHKSMAHTAFRTEYALREWARRIGIELPALPQRGVHGVWALPGSYRSAMHMELTRDQFERIEGERFRALSNGQYTLGIVSTDPDGIRTVHTMNPNCRDRPVFDFWESDAMTDTGQGRFCHSCGASMHPLHKFCPQCGIAAQGA